MMKCMQWFRETLSLLENNINPFKPWKNGTTRIKRNPQIILSLTSHPGRIQTVHRTIRTLLHQDYLPDRVVLWLAEEQFAAEEILPKKLLELKKYGLEIRWCHDIRSYKKLVPALQEFPDALVVTVDDDWYYRRDMLRVLIEEHERYPDEVICHDITHPFLDEENHLRTSNANHDYRGTSSFFNKILSGSGVLFSSSMLDPEVLKESVFMSEASTNDDIWFWAMAVKKGTKIRLAEKALGNTLMTDPEHQLSTSLGIWNSSENLYEKVTNRMLELYPEILENLLEESKNK
ncbi:MAG: hypothetical protein ACI4O4_02590 [Candidatus Ventricola sp.]